MASELNETLSRAADFLEQYAAFIHRVKPEEIEEHPYLPELEQIAADVRALSSPNNHTSSPTGGGAASHTPRFPSTYCSQCGANLGPGNDGASSCCDHGRCPVEARGDTCECGRTPAEKGKR